MTLIAGFGIAIPTATPAVATTGPSATPSSAANDACGSAWQGNCPGSTPDGYLYIYDRVLHVFVSVPKSAIAAPNPAVAYSYILTPDCPQARALADIDCKAATEFCAGNGQSGMHDDIWRSEISPARGPWLIVGQICTGGQGDPVTPQQAADAASEYERDHMPVVPPQVAPAAKALVNLPVIVNAADPGVQRMNVQQPIPGELVATATYSWKFDDGTVITGLGRPYDSAHDPRTSPGYYVSHTYTRPDPHASVTLTVTWNATFTAAGQTLNLPPVVMPAIAHDFVVDEAHAVLVSQ